MKKAIMDPKAFLKTMVMPHLDEFVAQGFEVICQQYLSKQYGDTIQEIGRYWFNDRTIVEVLASKAANLKPDRVGFFSKAGYVDGLDPANQYFTVDDLYHITASK